MSATKGGREHLTININGEKVFDGLSDTRRPPANGSDEVFTQTHTVLHTSSGANDFTVSVTYKCDMLETIGNANIGNLLPKIFYTIGTATITGTLTPIDQSPPQISGLSVKADRYGLNASASFTASHKSYILTMFSFKLSGLTGNKAYSLRSNGVGRHFVVSYPERNENGLYSIELFNNYLYMSETMLINLTADLDVEDTYPFDSGGSYPWELTVTALNGKQTKVSGTLQVPQKVTGIRCESQKNMTVGTTEELVYSVEPSNAEDPSVTFKSSDLNVATVDENGVVTALSEGACTITVTTVDGGSPDAISGFSAVCRLNILNTATFPILEPLNRYFTANDFNKMIFAVNYICDELTEKSIEAPVLIAITFNGRGENIKKIGGFMEDFYQNLGKLKTAAKNGGIDISTLGSIERMRTKNSGWQSVLNGWIAFLNKLHEKINGG